MTRRRGVRGVVLAGGRSSRFGADKALAVVRGHTLIARAVDLLSGCDLEPVVVSRPGWTYEGLRCATIHDREPHCGPLAGLYRAHREYPGEDLLVLTCDMPYLCSGDLKQLLDRRAPDADAVFYAATSGEEAHPFPGLYSAAALKMIDARALPAGRSMRSFIRALVRVVLLEPADTARRLININTPHDLALSSPER